MPLLGFGRFTRAPLAENGMEGRKKKELLAGGGACTPSLGSPASESGGLQCLGCIEIAFSYKLRVHGTAAGTPVPA